MMTTHAHIKPYNCNHLKPHYQRTICEPLDRADLERREDRSDGRARVHLLSVGSRRRSPVKMFTTALTTAR
jgi:hypothetical protein